MISIYEIETEVFKSECGLKLQREDVTTPNGNLFLSRWVLRDKDENRLDYDKSLNDMLEAHNLKIMK